MPETVLSDLYDSDGNYLGKIEVVVPDFPELEPTADEMFDAFLEGFSGTEVTT